MKIVRVPILNALATLGTEAPRFLEVALVRVVDTHTGRSKVIRALMDPGSEVNLISKSVVHDLGLTVYELPTKVAVKTVCQTAPPITHKTSFNLAHCTRTNIDTPIEALVMENTDWKVRLPTPLPSWVRTLNDLADPEFVNNHGQPLPFDLILDVADSFWAFLDVPYRHGKFGVKSTWFGLVPTGAVPPVNAYEKPPEFWSNSARVVPPKVPNLYRAHHHRLLDSSVDDDIQLTQDIARSY